MPMGPSRCLHSLPLRVIDSAAVVRTSVNSSRSFSISSRQSKATTPAKGPQKGVSTLRLKKKGVVKPLKSAEPGERRAQRKRIVLENTSALAVPKVQPFGSDIGAKETTNKEDLLRRLTDPTQASAVIVPDDGHNQFYLNQVLAAAESGTAVQSLPDDIVERLRAVDAFKSKQGWSHYRTPCLLRRKEALALGEAMDTIRTKPEEGQNLWKSGKSRRIICGERGSGKSVLLLDAMSQAFQKGWVVINIPEGRDLANGHTAFNPILGTNPIEYSQPKYTANLLRQILLANEAVLSKISITQKPKLPFPIRDNISLAGLLEFGTNDPERAWPIFQAFWTEITLPNDKIDVEKSGSRPPVLLCLDNLSYVMNTTEYQVLDKDKPGKLKKVHAHDLALVRHFMSHLSGSAILPNGGMALAATSSSDAPSVKSLDIGIAIAQTRQGDARGIIKETDYTKKQQLSPDRDPDPTALSNFVSPFEYVDVRVLGVLKSTSITRLGGLNHVEATQLMRYWTRSGLNRGAVLPWVVDEVKGLAGSGVVGQLENIWVRSIQRETAMNEGESGAMKVRQH